MKDLILDPKYSVTVIDGELRVVKTATREPIPLDEPTVLFRSRDRLAVRGALEPYRREALRDGCTDYHIQGIDNVIASFQNFALAHPERMKQPGITRGK